MISDNRLFHSIGVARMAKQLAMCLRPNDTVFAENMFLLGLLHDIGYEFTDDVVQHAKIGGDILARCGFQYADSVAVHGYVTNDVFSDELYILNLADMIVGSDGKTCTFDDRLDYIKNRYGAKSKQYEEAVIMVKKLKDDDRFHVFNFVD